MIPDPAPSAPAGLTTHVERLDHLALAVHDVRQVLPLLELLGATYRTGGHHGTQHFRWVQFDLPTGPKIELLEPLDPSAADHFLVRFLETRGEGPHHVTFKVDDIAAAVETAAALGYEIVGRDFSSEHWKEAFIHPKSAHGLLIQLAQWDDDAAPQRRSLASVLADPDPA